MESRKDYIIGICLLLVVVVLWTSSSFLTQGLFEDGYEKPFLMTYLNTASFALYLIPFSIRRAFGLKYGSQQPGSEYTRLATDAEVSNASDSSTLEPQALHTDHAATASAEFPPLTTRETAQLAAWFCFLWFIANWTVNAALDYTSVASATILSSMSGFFTLGVGRIFRVEVLTTAKIAAVVMSSAGVVLVSLSDSSEPHDQVEYPPTSVISVLNPSPTIAMARIFGDVLALLSALFYALYVTLLKVRIREESRIDMQLFFGFVGLFNILTCWPIGLALHLIGIERFELPYTSKAVVALLVNMGITLSSDYIYVLAMLKTTPLVVTVGLSLTMPLAVLGDFILQRPAKFKVILGASIVLLSFVIVGWEDSKNEEEPDMITGEPLQDDTVPGALRLEEEDTSEAG